MSDGSGVLLDNLCNDSCKDSLAHPNALVPGRRMQFAMTPTIVLNGDGERFGASHPPRPSAKAAELMLPPRQSRKGSRAATRVDTRPCRPVVIGAQLPTMN